MNNGRARYVWDYDLTQEQFDAMLAGRYENGPLYCGCDENRSFSQPVSQEVNSGFHTEQRIKELIALGEALILID